jgi:hypothetical protein
MELALHIFFHFLLSLIAGCFVFYLWRKPALAFIFAIIGGVAVDFDHFFDYLLAFGLKLNLFYFIHGYQFMKNDKIHLFFHAWEYVVILSFLAFILKNKIAKTIFLALTLGLCFHLISDVYLNEVPVDTYSITYRAMNNFDLQKLATPKHWQEHLYLKSTTNIE